MLELRAVSALRFLTVPLSARDLAISKKVAKA
jgi:hypothetical protein